MDDKGTSDLRRAGDRQPERPGLPAFRISLAYVVASAVWILASDRLLSLLEPDAGAYVMLQTYKGWFFVIVTGLLLFSYIRGEMKNRDRMAERLTEIEREHRLRISASLEEKEVLLREIHHRVKNNLQIVFSLLSLEGNTAGDGETAGHLLKSRNRVRAMSIVHEILYSAEEFGSILLVEYLTKLSVYLGEAFGRPNVRILIHAETEDVRVDLDRAIPLGLVLNEMVTNAVQHAFPRNRAGTVDIYIRRAAGTISLEVDDDGVGLDEVEKTAELGLKIIQSLAKQLVAEVTTGRNTKATTGTSIVVTIPFPATPTQAAEGSGAGSDTRRETGPQRSIRQAPPKEETTRG